MDLLEIVNNVGYRGVPDLAHHGIQAPKLSNRDRSQLPCWEQDESNPPMHGPHGKIMNIAKLDSSGFSRNLIIKLYCTKMFHSFFL
jgi:hypothetical protein